MMIDKHDLQISDVLWNYFDAVRAKWPTAWASTGTGLILNRTSGFKALMRFLRPAYLRVVRPGEVATRAQFDSVFQHIHMGDSDFNTDNYKPGTSGETALYYALKTASGV
jgi:hypothetical protein